MSDLGNVKLRMAAIELEALTTGGLTGDAVGYFTYWQEGFPYFTHRTGPAVYAWDSEDIQVVRQTFIIRAVCAHWNEGYQGTPDELVDTIIGLIRQKFRDVEDLTSAAYPTPPTYQYSEVPELVDDTGYRVFQDLVSGGTYQAGVEFTYRVPMMLNAS